MDNNRRPFFAHRFSLRTLLVLMLLLGPLGAVGWKEWQRWWEWEIRRAAQLEIQRQEELVQKFAEVVAPTDNMNDRISPKPKYEENRSDESFPESDPR